MNSSPHFPLLLAKTVGNEVTNPLACFLACLLACLSVFPLLLLLNGESKSNSQHCWSFQFLHKLRRVQRSSLVVGRRSEEKRSLPLEKGTFRPGMIFEDKEEQQADDPVV